MKTFLFPAVITYYCHYCYYGPAGYYAYVVDYHKLTQ